jgi:hypothetical protein
MIPSHGSPGGLRDEGIALGHRAAGAVVHGEAALPLGFDAHLKMLVVPK